MSPPRIPPRSAGMSRMDLPQHTSGQIPAVSTAPAEDWRFVDHENRVRALESSNVSRGVQHRADIARLDERIDTLHGQIRDLQSSSTRVSDFEELRQARLSELNLEREARLADDHRRRQEQETRRGRWWALLLVLVSVATGAASKAGCDWWTGPKPQGPAVKGSDDG